MSSLDKQVGGDHYSKYKIQPMEFFHENNIPMLEGSIMKYTLRHKDKNGVEDLDKAIHLLNVLKELEYPEK